LWRDVNGLLAYEITGDGFLRHMVRTIVGTLVEIGRGWREAESMGALLERRPRAEAGATAPAHGLYLLRVDYH
jgi:tRNA pseudouridine38-40 synthase